MTMCQTQIICAEAPVALVVADHGIYPLTTCCQAVASVGDLGFYCKACYYEVDGNYGDCWQLDDQRGWNIYNQLVQLAVQDEQLNKDGRTNSQAAKVKADEVEAYARKRAAAVKGA